MRHILFAALALSCTATNAFAERAADPLDARISTADVTAFYRIYDAHGGRPDAAALQTYIDQGSPGVRGFIPHRIESARNLAAVMGAQPQLYIDARACAADLGNVEQRVRAAFLALESMYPDATYPETYILVGAGNSGGTANSDALMIGLEVVCRAGAPDPASLDTRLAHLIAHEMVHSLQSGFAGESLLAYSLNEGVAEFVCELISGRISNVHLYEWTRGREAEIEQAFASQMLGGDHSAWLYNGVGTAEAPGDLGYWVGYRIAAAYYQQARDKRRAVSEMLTATDARAFLQRSGWRPATQ